MENKTMQTKTPWDSMTAAERQSQVRQEKSRPIRWTLDVTLAGTVESDGRVYVFCGGEV
jgi:hypothetical protein